MDFSRNVLNSTLSDIQPYEDSANWNIIIQQTVIGVLTFSLTIWTVLGNIFVLFAISTNKTLLATGISNYLVGNLALSDLLLGCTVLPFSAALSTFKTWLFGEFLCNAWLSIDVFCCTASIWCLCFIAIDRFIATNKPVKYLMRKNNVKVAAVYCIVPWIISLTLGVGPFLLPKTNELQTSILANTTSLSNQNNRTVFSTFECVLFDTPVFVVFSSLFSFFFPLVIMIILYTRVFIKINEQSKRFNKRRSQTANVLKKNDKAHEEKNQMGSKEIMNLVNKEEHIKSASNIETKNHKKGNLIQALLPHHNHHHHHKESQISSSEKRITKTLAIIMSCFTICWLPFFIIYIVRAILSNPDDSHHVIPEYVMDIFIWLGYLNSSLNPMIYLIVNINFRNSLREIFRCRIFKKNNSNTNNNHNNNQNINNKIIVRL